MNKKKNNISNIVRIVMFFAIMTILPVITFVLPKKAISENENRPLATMPSFNFTTYSEKTFMTGCEKFFADHFVLKENWVNLKNNIELLSGKKELNSVYICKNQLIEKLAKPKQQDIDNNIEKIKEFTQKYSTKSYLMVVPTASEIQNNRLPNFSINYNQKNLIDNIYDKTKEITVNLDAYTALKSINRDEIYYKTDHHWTSKGAFYTYVDTSLALGFKPYNIDDFNIEHLAHDFKGSLYSKTLYDKTDNDLIDIYSLNKVQYNFSIYDEKDTLINNDLYFKEYLEKKDKYCTFLGENRGYMKIINNNPIEEIKKKKLLIFKDSFANSIIPFYANHFEEIVVIDLRYINKELENYVNPNEFNKTLFLYNIDSFATQNQLKSMII